MPQEKTTKAVVATVNYAGFQFPGLKLPNGQYAIAVSQVATIFQFDQNQGSRAIKRLLNNGFQFDRAISEIHPKKVNILMLEDFGRLVNAIARSRDKAYEKARELAYAVQDASVSTTLEQAFDIAFNSKQQLEDYNLRVEVRVQNILNRRLLTDAIQEYVKANSHNLSENYIKWIEKNCSDAVNKIVFGRSAKKLREAWGCREIREMMSVEEQILITNLERIAAALIKDEGFEPLSAVKEAGNRSLIKVIQR